MQGLADWALWSIEGRDSVHGVSLPPMLRCALHNHVLFRLLLITGSRQFHFHCTSVRHDQMSIIHERCVGWMEKSVLWYQLWDRKTLLTFQLNATECDWMLSLHQGESHLDEDWSIHSKFSAKFSDLKVGIREQFSYPFMQESTEKQPLWCIGYASYALKQVS